MFRTKTKLKDSIFKQMYFTVLSQLSLDILLVLYCIHGKLCFQISQLAPANYMLCWQLGTSWYLFLICMQPEAHSFNLETTLNCREGLKDSSFAEGTVCSQHRVSYWKELSLRGLIWETGQLPSSARDSLMLRLKLFP